MRTIRNTAIIALAIFCIMGQFSCKKGYGCPYEMKVSDTSFEYKYHIINIQQIYKNNI